MSSPVFQLRLFPNTGHQFFAIDLEELLTGRVDAQGKALPDPVPARLRRFVELHQPADKRSKIAGWMPWSPYVPWVLFRYDFLADPRSLHPESSGAATEMRPVLLLAIESNLGDEERGILVGLDDTPGGEHPGRRVLNPAAVAALERSAGSAPPAVSPYFARPSELQDFVEEDGRLGLWLEKAFEQANVPLPSLLGQQERKDYNFTLPPRTVRVIWAESQGATPVDVDLIVDLGNSRTVALLLEDHGADSQHSFGKRVEPVHFLPRGWPYDHPMVKQSRRLEPFGLIDSWILLHRSTFAGIEPPFSAEKLRTFTTTLPTRPGCDISAHLIDQRFTSISPVLVGGGKEPTGAARTLARGVTLRANNDKGAPFFLSSPKRYAWDDTAIDKVLQYWKQVPNAHDHDCDGLAEFKGLVRLLMNPSSADHDLPARDLHDGPFLPQTDYINNATYPRSHAICWFALAILEAAHRQINSIDFLNHTDKPRSGLLRRMRKIRVTFPAGWTGQERERYFDQWRRAARLFTLAHLTRGDLAPELVDDPIDEAIASQLPLVVSEVKNLGGDANAWLKMFGDGTEARLLSLDIGGGTTDIAVVSYRRPESEMNAPSGSLVSSICYRDGHNRAGDELVKLIIERLIVPAWLKINGEVLLAGNPAARSHLEKLFRHPEQYPGSESIISQVLRLALIPLANEVLARVNEAERHDQQDLCIEVARVADPGAVHDINRLVLRQLLRSGIAIPPALERKDIPRLQPDADFIAWYSKLSAERPRHLPFHPTAEIRLSLADVRSAIDDIFVEVIRDLARVVHEERVNLVVVSGKPSELLRMRTILRRELPIPGQRILQVCGHWVGDWYPVTLVEGGRIRDAKTVTVTGAALYEDILNRNTTGFSLRQVDAHSSAPDATIWGIYRRIGRRGELEAPAFSAGSKPSTVDFPAVPLPTVFGRKLTELSAAEPVYRLDYVSPSGESVKYRDAVVALKLRRLDLPGGVGDALEIVPGSVRIISGPPELDPAGVQLRLRTMTEDAYWMDQPRFEVDFSSVGTS
jgi:Virulence factor SrfB